MVVPKRRFRNSSQKKDFHKSWLPLGIGILTLLILIFVFYSPAKEALFGKAGGEQVSQPLLGESNCGNNFDDDQDKLIDCPDSDCNEKPCGAGCMCFGGKKTEADCTDVIDNDDDGHKDCGGSNNLYISGVGDTDCIYIYNKCTSTADEEDHDGLYDHLDSCINSKAPSGLISYWAFQEGSGTKVYDSYNEGNNKKNGDLVGTATYTSEGKIGPALSFDGTNDYVELPASPALIPITQGELTIEAWIHPSLIDTSRGILAAKDSFFFGVTTINKLRFSIKKSDGTWQDIVSDVDSIKPGTWQHVAVTYTKRGVPESIGEIKFYVNGALAGTQTLDSHLMIPASTQVSYLGYLGWAGTYFKGIIDEVAIYGYALDDFEIRTHYFKTNLAKESYCELTEQDCGDNIDMDYGGTNIFLADGTTDCLDVDCNLVEIGQSSKTIPQRCEWGKELTCSDEFDNDANSLADCADPNCNTKSCGSGCLCSNNIKTESVCNDGFDNDGDTKTDCDDVDDCTNDPACQPETNCYDESDNDGDGFLNCEDPDCENQNCAKDGIINSAQCVYNYFTSERFCKEQACNDVTTLISGRTIPIDNDGDKLSNCADPDCVGETGPGGKTCESQETTCNDNFDNDGNALKDCADLNCQKKAGPRYTCCQTTDDCQISASETCSNNECLPPTKLSIPSSADACRPDAPNYQAPPDLLTYYSFLESSGTIVYDSFANNHGTLKDKDVSNADANTPPGFVDGKISKALSFDGTDDYVQLPGLGGWSTFTFEAWINPTELAKEGILSNRNNNFYLFGLEAGKLRLRIGNGKSTGAVDGTDYKDFSSDNYLVAGQWQHVAVTYNKLKVKFYIDGILVGERDVPSTLVLDTIGTGDATYIGTHGWVTAEYDTYFQGSIDEVAVYSQALNPEEIAEHYYKGKNQKNICTKETNCADGLDNDGDFRTDCGDADCASPACEQAFSTADACPSSSINIPEDIVSYWSFKESSGTTAYDSVLNNHGTLKDKDIANADANTPPGFVDGKISKALSFDGTDDYVQLPPLGGWDALTFEAWIFPTADELSGILGSDRYYLFAVDASKKLRFGFGDGTAWKNAYIYSNGEVLKLSQWNHVAVTYSKALSEVKFYVDGVFSGSFSLTPGDSLSIPSPASPTYLGYLGWSSGTFFTGKIDEVAIYNTALNPEEIAKHYYKGNLLTAPKYLCEAACPDAAKPNFITTRFLRKDSSPYDFLYGCCPADNNCVNRGGSCFAPAQLTTGGSQNLPIYLCGKENNWLVCDASALNSYASGEGLFSETPGTRQCNGAQWLKVCTANADCGEGETCQEGVCKTTAPTIILGDVNNDAVVNTGDAIQVLRYSLNLREFTPDQIQAADVTCDTLINTGDAIQILRYSLSLRGAFTACS